MAEVLNEVPDVVLAQGFSSMVIHVGKLTRSGTISACNGRSMSMAATWTGPATEVTCKRCVKLVTL
jgi:hypothetical protein